MAVSCLIPMLISSCAGHLETLKVGDVLNFSSSPSQPEWIDEIPEETETTIYFPVVSRMCEEEQDADISAYEYGLEKVIGYISTYAEKETIETSNFKGRASDIIDPEILKNTTRKQISAEFVRKLKEQERYRELWMKPNGKIYWKIYLLLGFPKEEYKKIIEQKIVERNGLISRAKHYEKEDELLDSIIAYQEANLTGICDTLSVDIPESINRIRKSIISTIDSIIIKQVDENNWKNKILEFGTDLNEQLKIEAYDSKGKLQSIPIIFQFRRGHGILTESKVITNNKVTTISLKKVNTILNDNEIQATIDIQRLFNSDMNNDVLFGKLKRLGLIDFAREIQDILNTKKVSFRFSSKLLDIKLTEELIVKWFRVVNPNKKDEKYKILFEEGYVVLGDRIQFEIEDVPTDWHVYFFNIDEEGSIWYTDKFYSFIKKGIETIDNVTGKSKLAIGWHSIILIATSEDLSSKLKPKKISKEEIITLLNNLSNKKYKLKIFSFEVKEIEP